MKLLVNKAIYKLPHLYINAGFFKNCEQRSNISFFEKEIDAINANTFLPNVTPYFVSCS